MAQDNPEPAHMQWENRLVSLFIPVAVVLMLGWIFGPQVGVILGLVLIGVWLAYFIHVKWIGWLVLTACLIVAVFLGIYLWDWVGFNR